MAPRLSFRTAVIADAAAIARLVNSAYRGDSSREGWTTEADLLGGQRTDTDEIVELIEARGSIVLLMHRGPELVGSVHLQRSGSEAWLGMLTIKPALQGAGLGKRFLEEAERVVMDAWESTAMLMTVISVRDELIAYYERRGYARTGELRPFPTSPRFGVPRVDRLEFAVLRKELAGRPADGSREHRR
jgi:ribosomal protein S18 acetylase RimI-like enzyme